LAFISVVLQHQTKVNMKYLILSSSILLSSCSITPEIIPTERRDSPMTLKLKDGIDDPGVKENNYSWLFWYAPVAAISLLWAKKEFLDKNTKAANDK